MSFRKTERIIAEDNSSGYWDSRLVFKIREPRLRIKGRENIRGGVNRDTVLFFGAEGPAGGTGAPGFFMALIRQEVEDRNSRASPVGAGPSGNRLGLHSHHFADEQFFNGHFNPHNGFGIGEAEMAFPDAPA